MARIVEHLPLEELEARCRAARDATEARHTQASWLPAQGRTFVEVAEVSAFAPRRVEELAARYDERPGPHGARRPAAAEWPGGEPADRRRAGRPGRAGAHAARRRRAVERPRGRRLDGGTARPRAGAPAARLGGAEADRLVDPGAAAAASAGGDARAAGGLRGGLDAALAEAEAAHPDRPAGRGLGR